MTIDVDPSSAELQDEWMEQLSDMGFSIEPFSNKVVIDKLITKSCKASVKAHDHLSMEEAKALLEQLKGCRNPFSCPHGRPTFIRFTQYQIEKFFKRIQ